MINNIKHLLRTIKHLFMILLIFLLLYDTEALKCYIHEAIVSLLIQKSTGLYPPELLILSGVTELRLNVILTLGLSFLIALASTKG